MYVYICLNHLISIPDVVIFSHRDEVIVPSDFIPLSTSVFLSCGVFPATDSITRWITPNEIIISQADISDPRLTIKEGPSIEVEQRVFDGTALIIEKLSYSDEGTYICEARSTLNNESNWVQASAELRLLGKYYL